MNETLIAEFKARLEEVLGDLEQQNLLGRDSQDTVPLDQQSVGRLSRMDAMQQQAMAKATQVRRNQQTLRAQSALERIQQGEFGYCVHCGDEIFIDRLHTDPSVPNCLSCAKG